MAIEHRGGRFAIVRRVVLDRWLVVEWHATRSEAERRLAHFYGVQG
jgi:hypothetical protein